MTGVKLQPDIILRVEFELLLPHTSPLLPTSILNSVFLSSRLSASSRIAHLLPEEQVYLNQQSGTIRLDCFTHCLIVKCAPDITVSPFLLAPLVVTHKPGCVLRLFISGTL